MTRTVTVTRTWRISVWFWSRGERHYEGCTGPWGAEVAFGYRAREVKNALVVRRLNFSSDSFHRWLRVPLLEELLRYYEMKMKRIMGRLFSLFFFGVRLALR